MKKVKAQMEILGLAIVIILLLVAGTFVVRNIALKSPTNYRNPFVTSEMASNMVNTILRTNTNCVLTVKELLQDCGQGSTIICPDGQDSCAYAESTARSIFSKTFDEWNINYYFYVESDNTEILAPIGTACRADKRSKIYPIPSAANIPINVRLDICL